MAKVLKPGFTKEVAAAVHAPGCGATCEFERSDVVHDPRGEGYVVCAFCKKGPWIDASTLRWIRMR